MYVEIKEDLNNILVVGDKVLLKPKTPQEKTKTGLYLPPGVEQKEKLHSGYIQKTGPGYPIPAINEYDEPWKTKTEQVKYVPLQAQVGDLAVYLQNASFEIKFNNEIYFLVPHSAILMLVRDDGLMK